MKDEIQAMSLDTLVEKIKEKKIELQKALLLKTDRSNVEAIKKIPALRKEIAQMKGQYRILKNTVTTS